MNQIVVRDRRKPTQFTVDNLIIDHWLPIIGVYGLALYNLYARMANKSDERSYPSFNMIQKHLSISRGTIANYNKILEWSQLIHVEPGDFNTSNTYYLLDIPKVTPELIGQIRHRAVADGQSSFTTALIKRLDAWRPIASYWRNSNQFKLNIIHKQGGHVENHSGHVENHSGHVENHSGHVENHSGHVGNSNNPKQQSKATIQSNNPKAAAAANGTAANAAAAATDNKEIFSLLQEAGISKQSVIDELATLPYLTIDYLRAHIDYAKSNHDSVGLLITRLRDGDPAPQPKRPDNYIPADIAHLIHR